MNTIGKNIKKLRTAASVTQDTLAEELHVTRQAVSNWETGKTQPDVETLSKIADYFQVTLEELIHDQPTKIGPVTVDEPVKKGVSFGMVLATVISYVHWRSIGWAIFHGLLGWVYVIYYFAKYC